MTKKLIVQAGIAISSDQDPDNTDQSAKMIDMINFIVVVDMAGKDHSIETPSRSVGLQLRSSL